MKKIIFNQNFSQEELTKIDKIKEYGGVSSEIAKILFSRNIIEESDVKRFLNKGKQNFCNPYDYKGVQEAVERISQAKENNENILIYGDYDADGISATATLYHSLKEYGIENLYTAIPERENGYGLNEEIITYFAENYFIDLVITVDCGISDSEKVDFMLNELGMDVIITDHHEIPSVLPETIIINPKLPGQNCFDGLCGAGVAFKLSTALIGDNANKYLDFVALATVADSMPIINENRDIVYEGLKLFSPNKIRIAFKGLISQNSLKDINTTTLAFQVAPRINAAGRMGDANSALMLFLSDDEDEIISLIEKLNGYNIQRQSECDKLYKEAKYMLEKEGACRNVIMLYNENWKVGFVGIVASKLVVEYSRPVIMFAGSNNILKGSARSIDGVNIFDAINDNKELLEEFGGHSQAAGVSIKKENFEKFYEAVDEYLSSHYDLSVFIPKINVEDKLISKLDISFGKELEILEPTGVGNRKPLFVDEIGKVDITVLKQGSQHISFKSMNADMIYFNGLKDSEILSLPIKKKIVFEINVSVFNNKSYIKGYVKEIIPEFLFDEDIKNNALYREFENLQYKVFRQEEEYTSTEVIKNKIKEVENKNFGTCFLINNIDNLKYYPELKNTDISIFQIYDTNLLNNILFCPLEPDLSGYKNIIYLDKPFQTINIPDGVKLIINKEIPSFENFDSLTADRKSFTPVFVELKRLVGKSFINPIVFYKENQIETDINMYLFAINVFFELKIFYVDKGIFKQNTGIKTDLGTSVIFNKVAEMLV